MTVSKTVFPYIFRQATSISFDVVVILLLFPRMPSILRPGFVVALIALTFSVMRSMASKANIPASIGIITKSEALRAFYARRSRSGRLSMSM